jgi:hypothetical protein
MSEALQLLIFHIMKVERALICWAPWSKINTILERYPLFIWTLRLFDYRNE